MLNEIETIKIQGSNFVTPTELKFFDSLDNGKKKTIKGALVYGRNGSGKSTIARAFRKIKGDDIKEIRLAQVLDENGVVISLTEEEKKQIYVFDEDYVNKHVKLKPDYLETIVMIGPVADLAEKIEKVEGERDICKIDFDKKTQILNEYKDIKNVKSPQYWLCRISNELRGDDAWAGRDREINGGRLNTQVRDDTYKKFINLKPNKSRSELVLEFREQMAVLNQVKSGSMRIEKKVPELPQVFSQYNEDKIRSLLEEEINRPELSERERFLLELVEKGKAGELAKQKEYFRRDDIHVCPYCFQPVSSEYKVDLVESIEKVLSKVVSEHQCALEKMRYNELMIDLTPYIKLESYPKCIDLIEKINLNIHQNNEYIEEKIENPYKSITKFSSVSRELNKLSLALTGLEEERIEYNNVAANQMLIMNKLKDINSQIAHYDIAHYVKEYNKRIEEIKIVEKEKDNAFIELNKKNKELEDLEADQKNVKIAIDVINACMKYIFFDENRLKIKYEEGKYHLYSKGKSVRPCDVSVGERNIIGLSYFFTSIMEGKEEKNAYGNECILIIDDPISSYDIENKIGIMSFLKYKLSLFLEGNKNTKALVMTHDLQTFFDIHKIYEEIINSCKGMGYANPLKFNQYEICNCDIIQFMYNKRQEYTEILKAIYYYGLGTARENEIIIGNMMRQALEAFSTFQYKKGIQEISNDVSILELLKEPEYQAYYKNLMYRLVLHGGSHKEEQIKAMKDLEFFSVISDVEKKRTAKEVLCFIYILNKKHVLEHLKGINDVESTLDLWCQEVKARAAMP